MLRPLAALAMTVLFLSACGQAPAATGVDTTLQSGGQARGYTLYVPDGLAAGSPLVIVLHGTPATGRTMENLTKFDRLADAQRFAVAYPNAVGAGTIAGKWQLGCCNAALRGKVDLHFLSDLIDNLARTRRVDRKRVYVVGFSLGAAMAYRTACELSAKVAGIASVGGFEYLSKPCKPDRPVSVYEIHGTRDFYGGSCGGQTQTNAGCGLGDRGYEPSVVQTNRQWRGFDACRSPARIVSFGVVRRSTWTRCSGSAAVRLDTVQNGGHCYPQPGTCGSYDATAAIWGFLRSARIGKKLKDGRAG
jgi:polyhydroxybutyrate depolymerase